VDTLNSNSNRSYPIPDRCRLIGRPDVFRQQHAGARVLVVSIPVAPLYLPALTASLGRRRIIEVILPDGGRTRHSPPRARTRRARRQPLGRDCALIALGGGVVGDLTGFARSLLPARRGVREVPRHCWHKWTRRSRKTGVNHPGGKNLIGPFHQPALVVIGHGTLATLPLSELRAGLAEVIKYGLI